MDSFRNLFLAAWHCEECDVKGRTPIDETACWNCGGEVTITARMLERIRDETPQEGLP